MCLPLSTTALRLFIENVLKTRKVVSLEIGRVINHQAFTGTR
jgi:hypothetical protein